jgi:hypothetical protein
MRRYSVATNTAGFVVESLGVINGSRLCRHTYLSHAFRRLPSEFSNALQMGLYPRDTRLKPRLVYQQCWWMILVFSSVGRDEFEIVLPTYTLPWLLGFVGSAIRRSTHIHSAAFRWTLKVPEEGCAEHFVLPCALSGTSCEWKAIAGWKRKHYWDLTFKNSNS